MAMEGESSEAERRMPGPLSVSILVVSYECREYLKACLDSIPNGASRHGWEVVAVDNASRDGSSEMIRTQFPRVNLIAVSENLGFARANNLAAESARAPWLLLLNPDTEVHQGAIDALLEFAAANPGHGIYGGRTLNSDGSANIASCWGVPTPWSGLCRATGLDRVLHGSSLFNPEGLGGWQRDSVREVGYVVGCWMLVETRLWRALDGFDKSFWMYGEDCDLCMRATSLIGLRPMVTPTAVITHHVGKSSSDLNVRARQIATSRATLIRKHWQPHWWRFGLACETGYVGLRALVQQLSGRKALREVDWSVLWRERNTWRSGYQQPTAASGVRRRPYAQARRFLLRVLDPRGWLHLLKMVNYWNYSHVAPRRQLSVGRNLGLAPTVNLANAERIRLGDDVLINTGAMLWAGPRSGRITIGSRVMIGPQVLVTASNYDISKEVDRVMFGDVVEQDVVIGNDVWIGAGAVILPGVCIGDGAIVGAGAVVSRDIAPFDIVTGPRAERRGSRT